MRLKRTEKPPSEFWGEFERTLRQKQLAALVERKPWWHGLAAAYDRIHRVGFPLGATAVLALTFLSIRYFDQPGEGSPKSADRNPARVTLARAAARPEHPPVDTGRVAHLAAVAQRSPDPIPAIDVKHSTAADEAPLAGSGQVSGINPWLGDVMEDHSKVSERSPSARSIAANLATVAVMEPELVDAVSHARGFEERAMPTMLPRRTGDVLPTAAAATEPRRVRLLASLEFAGGYVQEPAAPEHSKRSVTRYLTQDGWDRSISRLEAEGDRLSIKF